MELVELLASGMILLQITLLLWFIDTLGKIKGYLREIRDIAQRSGTNR